MTSIRMIALALVAAVASTGNARAQQDPASNSASSSGAQQSSRSSKTGACIIAAAGGRTHCTPQIDEAGCRAQGLESQLKTTWNAGQGCP